MRDENAVREKLDEVIEEKIVEPNPILYMPKQAFKNGWVEALHWVLEEELFDETEDEVE